ncbi:MAG: hypothetical protein GX581_04390 [Syntrophomonadaceae bacterium]|jgi:hypothetical protein|nr:hypothetical protein [Syntrophomonadaceae bacterium]
MKKRWGKGEPVNLSDLLRITPVANEVMLIAEELDISAADILWIAAQIIENNEEVSSHNKMYREEQELEDEWEEFDLEAIEDEIDQSLYMINVKITSGGRFPEVGFKAGVNDKEDISYFFEMIIEMLDKLE